MDFYDIVRRPTHSFYISNGHLKKKKKGPKVKVEESVIKNSVYNPAIIKYYALHTRTEIKAEK